MRLLTGVEQRELDRLAAVAGLPTRVLMETAGAAVADAVLGRTAPRADPGRGPHRVVIFCGPGNNGGDGYVCARFVREALLSAGAEDSAAGLERPLDGGELRVGGEGAQARVLCISTVERSRLKGDALGAAQAWEESGGTTLGLEAIGPLSLGTGDVVVDGVFGSGLSRPPAFAEARAIEAMNAAGARGARVIAIDVPSGIDADTGALYPQHLARADVTVTFHLPKRGLYCYPAAATVGEVRVAPIGLPASLHARLTEPACELLDEDWARRALAPRSPTSHKHDFGNVLVVAGSPGKSGAAAMVCEAALRAGAGLVTLAARAEVLRAAMPLLPEVMGVALPERAEPALGLADLAPLREALKGKTSLAIGPGIARGPETAPLIGELLAGLDGGCASVLDADALNALASQRESVAGWLSRPAQRPLLTPHAMELSRLTGASVEQLEAARLASATSAAQRFSACVVFKGARSVVADPDGGCAIASSGNPGMATAGSGDVLTGICAALLGRRGGAGGTSLRARLAVYLHGLAGDLAAAELGEESLIATDLVRVGLPRAFRKLGR